MVIFRENVIFLNLTAEKPTAILVSGKELSENFKKFYMDAWEKAN